MTRSGAWKRAKSDALATLTGKRFCMSCRTMQPTETVRRYRGLVKGIVLRCDSCQSKRIAPQRLTNPNRVCQHTSS